MFGLLGQIFGSGDVIKQGLKLIDDMHTSTEEQIEAQTKQRVEIMSAYAPFKLAQRFLALMFGAVFLGSYLLVLGMTISGKGNPDDVTQVMEQFSIDYAMLIILAFYFGGGVVDSVKAKK
jgi:hypothetical protein